MRDELAAKALFLTVAILSGCRIDTNNHGDNKNVKIATPFGGMQVKTDTGDVLGSIGLPAYPGATVVRNHKDDGKDENSSADVNMSFGSFQLKVKAVSYRTNDRPEDVLAFYKKAINRFGTPIQCDGKRTVGTPVRTAEGLTCDDQDRGNDGHVHIDNDDLHVSGSDDHAKYQLKAGSRKHQHIVDISPDAGGTKFGLVALDLPIDFNFGSNDKGRDNDGKQ